MRKSLSYVVLFEKTSNGYSAHAPDVPGCIAAARTLKRTARLMREAIEFHLESLRGCTENLFPQPTTRTDVITVSA